MTTSRILRSGQILVFVKKEKKKKEEGKEEGGVLVLVLV